MERRAKLALAGVVSAALIFATGEAIISHLEVNLHRLESECEVYAEEHNPYAHLGLMPVCKGYSMANSRENNIYGKVGQAQRNIWTVEGVSRFLAILVLVLFAAPWTWYFFLDRLRELTATFSGK